VNDRPEVGADDRRRGDRTCRLGPYPRAVIRHFTVPTPYFGSGVAPVSTRRILPSFRVQAISTASRVPSG
jgi:hypothetical protein